MNNVHTPERLAGESFDAYRERRAKSHAINKSNRTAGQGGINSRKQLRDSMRANGTMGKRTRAYVALTAAWAAKVVPNWKGERDQHGAFTLIGKAWINEYYGENEEYLGHASQPRRKWLAGISAQRGY